MLKLNTDILKNFSTFTVTFQGEKDPGEDWNPGNLHFLTKPPNISIGAPGQLPMPYSSAGNSSPTLYDLYFGSTGYGRSVTLVT